VLVLGFLAIAFIVTAVAVLAALPIAARAQLVQGQGTTDRPSRRVLALQSTMPPPAAVGFGMAMDPRVGTSMSVRSAIAGVALGAMGLVAVVVFAASLTSLVDSPARYGAPWDALVSGFSGDVDELGETLINDPLVEQVAVLETGIALIGGNEVNIHAMESRKGGAGLTLLAGRRPSRPGEAALGHTTMRDIDAHLGDTIEIAGPSGTVRSRIVGEVAFPVVDERSSVGRGALVAEHVVTRVAREDTVNRDLVVRWVSSVDPAKAIDDLVERTEREISAPLLPSDVKNLRDVESLPRWLGLLLAALAALALIHALLSTVRMRSHDLAVLRTLGFERRQLGATIAWQATTIVTIGMLVGLPLGIVAGRLIWRQLANSIGVVDDPTIPLLVVALVGAFAFVLANVAAALPARRAAHVPTASTLRTS
jgi:hypothetical protein